ncbi:MAG: DinB family protein [Chitinophagaceae bacterium]
MSSSLQIAKHFREVHFGGNWTSVNLKDELSGVDWQLATTSVHSLNTIAALVFHINYYVSAVLKVLQGGPLDAHDKYSFDCPPVRSPEDWDRLQDKLRADAEAFAALVEQLPDNRLEENLADPRYGNYYRNLHGIIEHTHYHLGQIVIIKKMLKEADLCC